MNTGYITIFPTDEQARHITRLFIAIPAVFTFTTGWRGFQIRTNRLQQFFLRGGTYQLIFHSPITSPTGGITRQIVQIAKGDQKFFFEHHFPYTDQTDLLIYAKPMAFPNQYQVVSYEATEKKPLLTVVFDSILAVVFPIILWEAVQNPKDTTILGLTIGLFLTRYIMRAFVHPKKH